jgi:2-methylcitrate dehydratase PrpD
MNLSRREILSGSVAAAAALPLNFAAAASEPAPTIDPQSGESLALARYVAQTRFEDLPADVVTMTKRAILDAIGVSLAASGLEPACTPFIELAIETGGPGEGTILGTHRRVPVVLAALANGSLAHAMDYEDAHEETRTHPNAAAVAAALPLAEKLGASGRDLIVAIALGCDVVCRLARALVGDGAPPPGFYQPAIVGLFGAATAAAKLLGLSAEQVLDTWSIALCQNSCTQELQDSPQSTIRAVREGLCARVGVESALLAAKGVRGFNAPFEGRSGFFTMYANGVQRQSLLTDLTKRYAGRDISFKAWPSCRDTHVYVQAALELLNERPLDPNAIESITGIVSEKQMIVLEPAASKRVPQTAIAAKFSLYFTLATALIDRRVDFESFSPEALRRADVLALANKVHYRVDAAAMRAGDVLEIKMRDGTVHRHRIKAPYGSPEAPLSEEALVAKFLDCASRAQKPATAEVLRAVAAQILRLEEVERVAEVVRQV